MMTLFDNPATLYQALLDRNPAYDGRVYVCVASTGIFCRLTCPARKPLFENCSFHETVSACVERGFRPCKRCHPLTTAAEADDIIQRLMAHYEQDPARRWTEDDIAALGFDPSTVRRSFKRHFGTTFLEFARLSRLRDGFETLAQGGRVIDAQLEAGFDSPSGFRAAFSKLLGVAPGRFTGKELLKADWLETPLGPMIAIADRSHLHLLEFAERKALAAEVKRLQTMANGDLGIGRFAPTDQIETELQAFFAGRSGQFDVPVALTGSDFSKTVWTALRRIPAGETRSYAALADAIGRPSAVRAVARANGANPLALVVPCHRVIGADGSLTGYGGGLWRKQKLIELERQYRDDAPKGRTDP